MRKNYSLIIGLIALTASSNVFAAAATAANYKQVFQGISAKFDRDWHSLNPQGKPDPGALATLEIFLAAFNSFGITGPAQVDRFISSSDPTVACKGPVTASCQHVKVSVTPSVHAGTLFGTPTAFMYDVAVWMDNGLGFTKFLQGSFSPVTGGLGSGYQTLISCGGCSTIGHTKIEWDGTGPQYHLRATMWDSKINNGSVFVPVVIDAKYLPASGDLRMAVAADRVCGATGNDSLCAGGNTTGYTALLHGNMKSGNVFMSGKNAASTDTTSPSASDQMCIKADGTQDSGTPSVCTADGSDTFSGMTAYTINNANAVGSFSNSNWPFSEITDSPTF